MHHTPSSESAYAALARVSNNAAELTAEHRRAFILAGHAKFTARGLGPVCAEKG
jgi:hypothetical protein